MKKPQYWKLEKRSSDEVLAVLDEVPNATAIAVYTSLEDAKKAARWYWRNRDLYLTPAPLLPTKDGE